ncbi:MAG: hypothetical protein IPP72_19345 [Chitinophagaceae bacterium]|nr:hypothetical protein [Chitinophagaceae bacterium]
MQYLHHLHQTGGASLYIPIRAITSAKLSPKATTLINTSSCCGVGMGNSLISNAVAALPFLINTAAFICLYD